MAGAEAGASGGGNSRGVASAPAARVLSEPTKALGTITVKVRPTFLHFPALVYSSSPQ